MPSGRCVRSGLFENVSAVEAVEMTLVIEMVLDRGMDGRKFLWGMD